MTTDLPPHPTDSLRVFRVPIALTVHGSLFVLADDLVEARRQARLADVNDHFDFNGETIWIPNGDDVNRLQFLDVVVSVVDLSGIIPSGRPANEHPDFLPEPRK